ncbi:MAG TPA: Rieske 2Fe-2S domain-containing protein [Candidatus Binatus sp.]|nr:Rieske 2Fe-2S domain-containing protein [Candidatus Binatus sp.]
MVGASFLVAAGAGVALLVVYLLGGQTQAEGVLLFLCLGGIGFGIVIWSRRLLPDDTTVEPRHPPAPTREVSEPRPVEEAISRRAVLRRLLVLAFGGLAAALAIPVLSLGPAPGASLFQTSWRRGRRLVGVDGLAVNASNVPLDGIVTVFPEGEPGSADGQAVLVHVDPAMLRLPPDRLAGAPQGFVCYSKVCTHAGCPVGLYRTVEHRLLCPCHQSTFDVLAGATPVSGPAARPLPQLPIQLQADGTFAALGDFSEPIGPSFWNVHAGA